MTDYRYTLGDRTVEAYQITEASRYRQSEWPNWLDSRSFITIDGATWIDIAGKEQRVPDLAWIVLTETGNMEVVGSMEFENYVKLVKDAPDPHLIPTAAEPVPEADTSDLLIDIQAAIQAAITLLKMGEADEALNVLTGTITKRVTWCTCPPGQCEGGDEWSCREKSPLLK